MYRRQEKVLILLTVLIFGVTVMFQPIEANAVDFRNNSRHEHPVVLESPLTEADPFPSHHYLKDLSNHDPNIVYSAGRSIATVCDGSSMLLQGAR